MLLGDNFDILKDKTGLIIGCGGVGGVCIDAIYRAGITNLTVIDCDIFEVTNQNRQLLSENLNMKKALVFEQFYPGVKGIVQKIDSDFLQDFDISNFDFIVDAIDDINAKVAIAVKIFQNQNDKIFISSMGGAKRIDPQKIKICDIFKTNTDALAKKFRYELKKAGFRGHFDTIFSTEQPKCISLGSLKCVTATFGLFAASYVIQKLIEKYGK